MLPGDKTRAVLVYGADERPGQAICNAKSPGIDWVPRSSEFFGRSDLAVEIPRDIEEKKPVAVVNCLADPGGGKFPGPLLRTFVAPTLAMVQACRRLGIRYIQCSSARVFGQREFMADRDAYSEYDPAVGQGDDPWRDTLLAMEQVLLQQTSFGNAAAVTSTHPGFDFYLLRLGELIRLKRRGQRNAVNCSLDIAIDRMLEGDSQFYCDDPRRLVSLLDPVSLGKVVGKLCEAGHSIRGGTYHIAAKQPVSLEALFHQIAIWTGIGVCVGPECAAKPGVPHLYGLDSDQALDVSYWQAQSDTDLPTWDGILRSVLSANKAMTFMK